MPVIPFQWIDVKKNPPRDGMDCIVLTEIGTVCRAVADSSWQNGFCTSTYVDEETGKRFGDAVGHPVTHYVPFVKPSR